MGRSTTQASSNPKGEASGGLIIKAVDNSRIVYLHGNVDEESICEVQKEIITFASKATSPVTLVISTYGGAIDEMFSLYDVMNFVPCAIRTVGLGKIMSAGVLLLAAGEKGSRTIGPNARVMLHSLTSGFYGNVFEFANETDELQRVQSKWVDLIVKHTKMTRDDVIAKMDKKVDQFITAEEAVSLGIADKIL